MVLSGGPNTSMIDYAVIIRQCAVKRIIMNLTLPGTINAVVHHFQNYDISERILFLNNGEFRSREAVVVCKCLVLDVKKLLSDFFESELTSSWCCEPTTHLEVH